MSDYLTGLRLDIDVALCYTQKNLKKFDLILESSKLNILGNVIRPDCSEIIENIPDF